MNRAIEIHDSIIGSVIDEGREITASFSPAYVHESEGIPGRDNGTGWTQSANVTLHNAVVSGAWPTFPADLWDGALTLGTTKHDNIIPLPTHFVGSIELVLEFGVGRRVAVHASAIDVVSVGAPTYVEEYRKR